MQLNFLGLVLVAVGIVCLGLGISGNYKTFGKSVKASAKKPTGGGGSGGGGGGHPTYK